MATKVKLIADGVITPDQITLTTASTGTNTTAPATTAFVQQEISALVDSSPDALNTLNELAAALGDDANFSTTVTNSIATKLPLAGGTLTGDLTVPYLATTSYIDLNNSGNRGKIGYDSNHVYIASTSSSGSIIFKNNVSSTASPQTGGDTLLTLADGGVATFTGTVNDLTLAASGISGNASNNFALNTPHSLRINIDSDNNATDQDFIIGNNQTAVNQSNVLFKVQENGNVGIGTTSMSSSYGRLTVAGTGISITPDTAAKMQIGRYNAANPYSYIKAGSTSSGFKFTNAADSVDIFTIENGGNVGIGTTSPANNLHIHTDSGDEGLTIKSTGNTSNAIIFDANRSGAGSSIGEIQSKWNGTTVAMIASLTGSDTTNKDDGEIVFYTSSANNLTERMRIDSSGNVGIGTSNPSRALLHVGGDGIALNTATDVSKTAILRTSGGGNYSTSGNGSAAHALTLMRGNNAADGDQVGLSFVLDNGNWSATSEIMAEVEQASSANTRLNFKTWNASGAMRTTQYITSEGQVVKPYQSGFYAVKSSAQTISVNQAVVFNTATENVGADYNTSNGVYTAPISGFYIFSYTILLGPNLTNDIDVDHYLKTSNRSYIGGMPGRTRYLTTGTTGWGDGYMGIGHTQIAYMDAGDTAYVDFSQLYYNNSNGSAPVYANTTNNWTKFSGYFLG